MTSTPPTAVIQKKSNGDTPGSRTSTDEEENDRCQAHPKRSQGCFKFCSCNIFSNITRRMATLCRKKDEERLVIYKNKKERYRRKGSVDLEDVEMAENDSPWTSDVLEATNIGSGIDESQKVDHNTSDSDDGPVSDQHVTVATTAATHSSKSPESETCQSSGHDIQAADDAKGNQTDKNETCGNNSNAHEMGGIQSNGTWSSECHHSSGKENNALESSANQSVVHHSSGLVSSESNSGGHVTSEHHSTGLSWERDGGYHIQEKSGHDSNSKQSVVHHSTVSHSTTHNSTESRTDGHGSSGHHSSGLAWERDGGYHVQENNGHNSNSNQSVGRHFTVSHTTESRSSGHVSSGHHSSGLFSASNVFSTEHHSTGHDTSGNHSSGHHSSAHHSTGHHSSGHHSSGHHSSGHFSSASHSGGHFSSAHHDGGGYDSGSHYGGGDYGGGDCGGDGGGDCGGGD